MEPNGTILVDRNLVLFKRTNDLITIKKIIRKRHDIVVVLLLSAKSHQSIVPVLGLLVASKGCKCGGSLVHFQRNCSDMHVLLIL